MTTRVTVRGAGIPPVKLAPGESLAFGRAPHDVATPVPGRTLLALPGCAPHVSRLVAELQVDAERVVLHWVGAGAAQLSGLFDAPGGARRVSLTRSMSALLDDGENQLVVLLGREQPGGYSDLVLSVEVAPSPGGPQGPDGPGSGTPTTETSQAPGLERYSRNWYVALALAQPWLSGNDDYPRAPSNREIYERVLRWHGYAWNLKQPQRVDEAIRAIARVAFGPRDDPFAAPHDGRLQNLRYPVARRTAEVRLVTADDLAEVERGGRGRKFPPPDDSPDEPTPS